MLLLIKAKSNLFSLRLFLPASFYYYYYYDYDFSSSPDEARHSAAHSQTAVEFEKSSCVCVCVGRPSRSSFLWLCLVHKSRRKFQKDPSYVCATSFFSFILSLILVHTFFPRIASCAFLALIFSPYVCLRSEACVALFYYFVHGQIFFFFFWDISSPLFFYFYECRREAKRR